MKLKLPKKSEIQNKIPDKKELEDLFFRGYRMKRKVELMEESIIRRQEIIASLNKTRTMKTFRTQELLIHTTHKHIKAIEKRFKKLFELE